jgi:DNA-binding winged helix-turn-helix (wHTH) protein
MKVSLKSLLSDANNGFVTLPYLTVYREELEDSEVVVEDCHVMTCLYSIKTRRLMLFNPLDETTFKKSLFKTLNRKGFEAHKQIIWEAFNKYQTTKTSRYFDKNKKRVVLTYENFEDMIKKQFDEIEKFTLFQLYDYENRIKAMRLICEQYGLDYENFKKQREEARTKV